MTTLLLTHPCFVEHNTGYGHPERPDRMRAIDKVLGHDLFAGLKRVEAPLREDVEEAIALAQTQAYIAWVKSQRPAEGEPPVRLDPDTVLSAKSWEPALRAVGAGLAAVDRVMDKSSGIANAFCPVRPPGHHATTDRAMGFCIFNNVAIAARYAQKKHGIERVLIVDWDVHHGNGTQDIFYADARLLLLHAPAAVVSRHRRDWRRRAAGKTATRRCRPGAAATHSWTLSTRPVPRLATFKPDFLLVSAGFDARQAIRSA